MHLLTLAVLGLLHMCLRMGLHAVTVLRLWIVVELFICVFCLSRLSLGPVVFSVIEGEFFSFLDVAVGD
jgi:hypothetical protein